MSAITDMSGSDWAAWAGIVTAWSAAMWRVVKTTMRNVIADYLTAAKIAETLAAHDTALALLIQQVMPPGQKSLRDLLQDILVQQAQTAGATTSLAQSSRAAHGQSPYPAPSG